MIKKSTKAKTFTLTGELNKQNQEILSEEKH